MEKATTLQQIQLVLITLTFLMVGYILIKAHHISGKVDIAVSKITRVTNPINRAENKVIDEVEKGVKKLGNKLFGDKDE